VAAEPSHFPLAAADNSPEEMASVSPRDQSALRAGRAMSPLDLAAAAPSSPLVPAAPQPSLPLLNTPPRGPVLFTHRVPVLITSASKITPPSGSSTIVASSTMSEISSFSADELLGGLPGTPSPVSVLAFSQLPDGTCIETATIASASPMPMSAFSVPPSPELLRLYDAERHIALDTLRQLPAKPIPLLAAPFGEQGASAAEAKVEAETIDIPRRATEAAQALEGVSDHKRSAFKAFAPAAALARADSRAAAAALRVDNGQVQRANQIVAGESLDDASGSKQKKRRNCATG